MKKFKQLIQEIGVLSLSITIVFVAVMGISMVKGWTEPTAVPPGGNLGAPLNTSATTQNKAGGLGVSGIISALAGIVVGSPTGGTIPAGIRSQGDICTNAGGGKCLSASGGGGVAAPPYCMGANYALQWNGSSWACTSLTGAGICNGQMPVHCSCQVLVCPGQEGSCASICYSP